MTSKVMAATAGFRGDDIIGLGVTESESERESEGESDGNGLRGVDSPTPTPSEERADGNHFPFKNATKQNLMVRDTIDPSDRSTTTTEEESDEGPGNSFTHAF